ncbi:MAG TPA: 3-phosphoshikimate 1-carboxyvinyltransferase, partial [Deinococcales bacterium]|nr:3-phosphoshikimate 1-carboxyvinyltransferase [Deinococcales bacterium]
PVLEVHRPAGPLRGTVRPPGSKSYTNRALVLAALAGGETRVTGALDADDPNRMAEALVALGFEVRRPRPDEFVVTGAGGTVPAREAGVYIGNAGTAARFLPPLMALGAGTYRLDGDPAMRRRPLQPLLDALSQLGLRAKSDEGTGCPPVTISGGPMRGGEVRMPGHVSSQFISGLLMAGAVTPLGLRVRLTTPLVSRPYLDVTAATMAAFGVDAHADGEDLWVAPGGQAYRAGNFAVEPDATAASYFFATAAITGGTVTVDGLGGSSHQGDLAFVDVLERMGCRVDRRAGSTTVTGPEGGRLLGGFEVNMGAISDTAQTLAAIVPFADSPVTVTGIGFIRRKETDRLAAVTAELTRLGVRVDEGEDGWTIHPGQPRPGTVQTYDDHRMAMSFAVLALRAPGVLIANPACVSKTYPRFFEDLSALVRASA